MTNTTVTISPGLFALQCGLRHAKHTPGRIKRREDGGRMRRRKEKEGGGRRRRKEEEE
jgi:hypothetical protein